MNLSNILAASVLLMSFMVPSAGGDDLQAQLTFCLPEVQPEVRRMNASFNIAFDFDIEPSGQPNKITPVLQFEGVDLDGFVDCVAEWRIESLSGKEGRVIFYWKHGFGWKFMTLAIDSTSLTVNFPINQYKLYQDNEACPE